MLRNYYVLSHACLVDAAILTGLIFWLILITIKNITASNSVDCFHLICVPFFCGFHNNIIILASVWFVSQRVFEEDYLICVGNVTVTAVLDIFVQVSLPVWLEHSFEQTVLVVVLLQALNCLSSSFHYSSIFLDGYHFIFTTLMKWAFNHSF